MTASSRHDRRRTRLARPAAALFATAASAATLAVRSRFGEPYSPLLERIAIASNHVAADGPVPRVGFVTDTHVGPAVRAADVDRALALLSDTSPDLLLFGGDYICESPRFIPEVVAAFRPYAMLPKCGAFAVFGNHDYSNDAPRLQSALERIGVRVLRNEGALVCLGQRRLWIAGIDDAVLGQPDPDAAFAGRPPDAAAIAIWHVPDWAQESAARGADLQLSGHSHGGQIRLPGIGHIAAPSGGRRFVAGINHVDGMPVYTSRGVGVYRPPVRLNCQPEVTLITLRPAEAASVTAERRRDVL